MMIPIVLITLQSMLYASCPRINLTRSTNALNECGSFTANSAKIFLSTHTFSRASALINSPYLTPCSLVAALILVIQSARQSRFLLRRSRYWYCHAFSTRLRAILTHDLARPRMPLAALKILSRIAIARAPSSDARRPLPTDDARRPRPRRARDGVPHIAFQIKILVYYTL